MIKVAVISYNNQPPSSPLSAIFGKNGGTLGRSDNNDFVLPDIKRHVSRLQASIKSDGKRHTIVNLSRANPILVNGQEIDLGQEYDIKVGDEIQIGLYLLRVESHLSIASSTQNDLPDFDDLFVAASPPDAVSSKHSAPAMQESFDPFFAPSPSVSNTADPLADLLMTSDATLDSLRAEKIDLLLSPAYDPASSRPKELEAPDTSNLGVMAVSIVDPLALFSSDPILPSAQNNTSHGHAVPDHVMEIHSPFMPLQVKQTLPCQEEIIADVLNDTSVITRPPERGDSEEKEEPAHPLSQPVCSQPDRPPQNVEAVTATNNSDHQALLQAFLHGAGLPPDTIASMTPELMEKVGKLLATVTQGTVELIASRALVKREVKADVTMIVPKNNNPLKFLPDGQSALIQMFGKPIPGFMGPVEAMQDAYEDMRAHQIGVVAGMRAAMNDVLNCFNPEQLTTKLQNRTMIDAVLPVNRKAKLWDLYVDLFREVHARAQDDFQTLFGKAFLVEYQAEIERFKYETHHD